MQTAASFAPGSYTLSFDLGGNARGDVAKTTTITLGDWTRPLTLGSSDPLTLSTVSFATTGGRLSFSDNAAGNQNIFAEDCGGAGAAGHDFAGLGFAGYRSSRKGARLES